MYSLILKDLLIQKKIVLLSFVFIIFFSFTMQGAGYLIFPTALTALTYMLVITSCAYDDKSKADVMLNSLPLKRSSIVLAKYLSLFVYIALCTVLYLLTMAVIALTGMPAYPISLEGLIGGMFAVSLINSIYFPFYFKFGYIKSRFLNFILFFTFYFGLTSVIDFIYTRRDVPRVIKITNFFQGLTDMQIAALLLSLILIILGTSYFLSVKMYQSRDL